MRLTFSVGPGVFSEAFPIGRGVLVWPDRPQPLVRVLPFTSAGNVDVARVVRKRPSRCFAVVVALVFHALVLCVASAVAHRPSSATA